MGKESKKKDKTARKQKIRKFSIKARIILIIIGAVIGVSVLNALTSIPVASSSVKKVTNDYLLDLVCSSGMRVEEKESSVRGTDLTAKQYEAILKDVGVNGVDSSYAYITSKDGMMLYHPTEEKIGKPVENEAVKKIVGKLENGDKVEPQVIEYVFKGAKKYAACYVLKNSEQILVVSADEKEVMSPIYSMINRVIFGALGTLVVAVLCSYIFVRLLSNRIGRITAVVRKMGALDFSKTGTEEKLAASTDETGEMGKEIVVLQKAFRETFDEIKNQSNKLFEASETLGVNVNETVIATDQVDKAVQDIASGASSQAGETQKATEHIIVMGNMIEKTSKEVEELRVNSNDMHTAGQEAMKTLSELDEINNRAKESVEIIYEQTNTTNVSALKIREATTLITSIAEETNLLSLNASIEAARAGEQGRGFAVVAAQIQKLAEQSNDSARQIEAIIDSLIADSDKAVQTMDSVKEIMQEQSEKVVATGQMFNHVEQGIASSLNKVDILADKTDELDKERVGVVDVVQNLTAIAEENAAGTEETSASVTEVGSIMNNIADNVEQLKQIAKKLDTSMAKFHL